MLGLRGERGLYLWRDKSLTLAGLRGSRQTQPIERLGANNHPGVAVRRLMLTGSIEGEMSRG